MNEAWVLVVDGNRDDTELVSRALREGERREKLETFSSGHTALEFLSNQPVSPSLILLDGRLPGMSFTELLACLRENPTMRFVPIVVLSGENHDFLIEQSLTAGASSFVQKSVDFDELMQYLRATLHYWLDVHRRPTLPADHSE